MDGSLRGQSAAQVLEQTGWARSVGGAGPYLTLFARGCTYVAPACDYAIALKAGQAFFTEMKTAQKLGVSEAEIGRLCGAILAALASGPLDTDELRQAVGGAARSLGAEGVNKGLTTTLPVGLGKLQAEGEIRRIPVNGCLDQQRYRYALWRPGPPAASRLSEGAAYVELARRYFRWIAPARQGEFQWFSGLGAKAAKG